MNKIVCIVRGGSIQDIYSSDVETKVEIIDLDNENITDGELKAVVKDLKTVY